VCHHCCCAGSDWDWSGRAALPAAALAAQSSPQQQAQQQQQQPQVTVTLEDVREKVELQRSYYSMLLAVTTNNLTGSLLHIPPQVLDNIMTALARGAATHVDPALRKGCIQVGFEEAEGGHTAVGIMGALQVVAARLC